MNRKHFIQGLEMLLSFLACFIFLWAWICYVEPFPDRDSLHQMLYPVINYLKASTIVGNDFIFLKRLMPSEYPFGILLIPWSIAVLGLQNLFIEIPWLFTFFLMVPLGLSAWLVEGKSFQSWITLLLLFFFPPVQIALKNLNLHSFIILYNLAAIFLIYDYRKNKRTISLILAIIIFVFTCAVKHLGLILFVNLWIAYLLWKKRKKESLSKTFYSGLLIIFISTQLYPEQSLIPYFESLRNYNPLINSTLLWVMGASAIFLLLFSWFQGVSEDFGRIPIEHLFINLRFFVITGLLTISILVIKPDFHGLIWMLLCFVVGNGFLIALLRWGQFETENGFMILSFVMLTFTALVFYFSRLGQISAFFVLPNLLLLILLVQSNIAKWKIYCVGALFFVVSNFFPSLTTLESLVGSYGFRLYARGFNMIHQNPLGWQPTKITYKRESLRDIFQKIDFTQSEKPILMARYGLHHHNAVQLHYPDQYLHDIPQISLPEDLPSNHLRSLYSDFIELNENFHTKLLEQARLPLIIAGDSQWVKYEEESFPEVIPGVGTSNEVDMFRATRVKKWLHDPFFEFLKKEDLLSTFYKKYSLVSNSPRLDLYVHRKLLNLEKKTPHMESLKHLRVAYRRFQNPKLRMAQDLTLRSNAYLDNKQVLAAFVLLSKASHLDPENKSISNKMKQTKLALRNWEIEILEKYSWEILFETLADSKSLPWVKKDDWKNSKLNDEPDLELIERRETAHRLFKQSAALFDNNPEKAIELLHKVLEFDPTHQEALKDLKILRKIRASEPEELEIKKRNAELLFKKSNQFFETDPKKAADILTKVLKLDPKHAAAKEDLALIKNLISKGWRGPKTPEHKKADELFKEASNILKSDPSRAKLMLEEAISLDPNHREAIQDIKIVDSEISRANAVKFYHQSLQYQARQPYKALDLLEKAVQLDPNHEIAKRDIRQIKTFLGSNSVRKARGKWFFSTAKSMLATNRTQALLNLQKALEMDPGNKEAHKLHMQLSKPDKPKNQ